MTATSMEPGLLPYKVCDGRELKLHVFQPAGNSSIPRPVVVFFHGGGWGSGTPQVHYPNCVDFATRDWVAISVQYRLKDPIGAISDAKSAIRFIRSHAGDLGIDAGRMVVGGSSAGGHLAAMSQMWAEGDDEGADVSISAKVAACVLLSPVLDTGPTGFGHEQFEGHGQGYSPVHLIRPGLPPMLILHGTADETIPFEQARSFHESMVQAGNRCDLHPYPDGDHIFWRKDEVTRMAVLDEIFAFLAETVPSA